MALTTGESITDAIGAAAAERIVVSGPLPSIFHLRRWMRFLAMRSFKLQPINTELTDDEILGYGPDGICE